MILQITVGSLALGARFAPVACPLPRRHGAPRYVGSSLSGCGDYLTDRASASPGRPGRALGGALELRGFFGPERLGLDGL